MDPLDVPTPLEVEDDLKQIVHNLERWEALPLRALRALPSVQSWTPPQAERKDYEGQPAKRRSNAAIHYRIEEAITRTVLVEDQHALTSLFRFDELTLTLKVRQAKAAVHRKVTPEGFRKKNEKVLLRQFAEEVYRWELELALGQSRSLNEVGGLDTTPSVAAQ